jgi:hypothetical protein
MELTVRAIRRIQYIVGCLRLWETQTAPIPAKRLILSARMPSIGDRFAGRGTVVWRRVSASLRRAMTPHHAYMGESMLPSVVREDRVVTVTALRASNPPA